MCEYGAKDECKTGPSIRLKCAYRYVCPVATLINRISGVDLGNQAYLLICEYVAKDA